MSLDFRALRKADPAGRRALLSAAFPDAPSTDAYIANVGDALSDSMVEQALGYFAIPLGIAGTFTIDGQKYLVPMATEEPSVIAAASFAATRIGQHGGFSTQVDQALMSAQIFVDGFLNAQERDNALARLNAAQATLSASLEPLLDAMRRRGGGLQSIQASPLAEIRCLKVEIVVNVCDAMGANVLNTCAEALRTPIETISGCSVLMAILSNSATERLARASFTIPVESLARGGFSGAQAAQRLVRAARMADLDPHRAVTHNKGIMNGITALCLACGNDTRAVEAAAHAWAARSGHYSALSNYQIIHSSDGDLVRGSIELPLALGTIGGAISCHPAAQVSLAILAKPQARTLAGIAASLGLAQNFAALSALSAEGIQAGHMRLHARRNFPPNP